MWAVSFRNIRTGIDGCRFFGMNFEIAEAFLDALLGDPEIDQALLYDESRDPWIG